MQAYLDKLLSAGDMQVVEEHLAVCSDCAAAYRFEIKLRAHVKACCGGQADEDHCREELLAKLKSCCGGSGDERTA
jgi:anti-sigma factor RsiW